MSPSPPPERRDTGATAPPSAITLRYRTEFGAPPPRRIHLEIPGWSGDPTRPGDGSPALPWHCRPFVEGSTYGLELVYPYPNECHVHNDGGRLRFEGGVGEAMREAGLPHPFDTFAAGHYGMATALDLLPPDGHALRLGPHPRYFTDRVGDVPLAVPGHLQRFWPRQFFAVFKAPAPGTVHVFRPGEAYAQLLVVPTDQAYVVEPMEPAVAAERARQDRQVNALTYFLSKRLWQSDRGHWFNDRYKQLLRVFRRGGDHAVRQHLDAVEARISPKPPAG